ncbi:MAG: hypothetical protein AAGI91_00150 [Bacteroidota bacterium]
MTHRTTAGFWKQFDRLPESVQRLARKNYRLLEADPRHPSLHFKKLPGTSPLLWSVRIGRDYRAVALDWIPRGI